MLELLLVAVQLALRGIATLGFIGSSEVEFVSHNKVKKRQHSRLTYIGELVALSLCY